MEICVGEGKTTCGKPILSHSRIAKNVGILAIMVFCPFDMLSVGIFMWHFVRWHFVWIYLGHSTLGLMHAVVILGAKQ